MVEFKQFKEFTDRMKDLKDEQVDQFYKDCAKELTARLLTKTIKRTPVGVVPEFKGGEKSVKVSGETHAEQRTVSGQKVFQNVTKKYEFNSKKYADFLKAWEGYEGGTLRRGWTGGANVPVLDFVDSLSVAKTGKNYTITIKNPVEYASYVEYGHRQTAGRYVPALGVKLKSSWVKGKFMLTISEQEINLQAASILEKKLTKFLKGLNE